MKLFRNIEPYEAVRMTDFVIHKGHRISSKAIIDKDAVEIRFFSASAGEEIDKESYRSESIFICLTGKLKILYNEEDEVILEAGQMMALDHGIHYGLEVLEQSVFYSILVSDKVK